MKILKIVMAIFIRLAPDACGHKDLFAAVKVVKSSAESEYEMVNQTDAKNQVVDTSSTIRSIWITLEAPELIELKRISIDSDWEEAINYFFDILWPRVHTAAIQRGIELDPAEEIKSHDHLS